MIACKEHLFCKLAAKSFCANDDKRNLDLSRQILDSFFFFFCSEIGTPEAAQEENAIGQSSCSGRFLTFGYRKDLSGAQSGFVRDKVGVS